MTLFRKNLPFRRYELVYKKQIYPYPVLLVSHGYSLFHKEIMKTEYALPLAITDSGLWSIYLDRAKWKKRMQNCYLLFLKNHGVVKEFRNQFEKVSRKFLFFSASLDRDYTTLNDAELLALYEKYNEGYIRSFIYGEPLAKMLKDYLEQALMSSLKKRNGKAGSQEIFECLSIPTEQTFMQREEQDLLLIAAGMTKTKLVDHAREYAWIPVDYNGNPWTIDHFRREFSKLNNPGIFLEQKRRQMQEFSRKQELALRKLDAGTDAKFSALRDCISLMDRKREIYTKSHYHLQFLMREIVHRLHISYQDVHYLIPKEVHDCLAGKRCDRRILRQRFLSSAYLTDGQSIEYLAPSQESFVRKIIKGNSEGKMLRGKCAYPGRKKGNVCIILAHEDFHLMKEGDILVTPFTTPDFLPVMRKAAGILTEYGGITSHAAIIARELHIPCIVGIPQLMDRVSSQKVVEMDAAEGIVKIQKNMS